MNGYRPCLIPEESSKFDIGKVNNSKFDNGKINNSKFDNDKVDNSKFNNDKVDNSKFNNDKVDNRESDHKKREVIAVNDIERAYMQHAKEVYRYLLSLSRDADLAEELTQETFFRAMRTIGNYDGSCKLSVWLCQIGRHLWYQWLEKHSRRKQTELTEEMPGEETPEKAVLWHMEKMALYQAIHELPEPMREIVHMRLTGEFSFGEIGEILGKSENWARVTFYRAKKKMMERMEGSE